MTPLRAIFVSLLMLPAFAARADETGTPVLNAQDGRDLQSGTLQQSDREYLIAQQASTMAPMSLRVGTVDQLQTVQGATGAPGYPNGFYSDVFVDFAPLSWLTVGMTANYQTFGDAADEVAPTAYVKAQILNQESAGVNMAAEVQYKKFGFQDRPITMDNQQNQGELEAMVLLDRRIGRLDITGNAAFGKSYTQPDADAELRLAAGYLVRSNVLVGFDSITRYDASFDGGPKDGTRYYEFTGGPMATWKVSDFTLSGLAGLSAPMHMVAVGPTAMVQVAYAF